MTRVLVVSDDYEIGGPIADALSESGHEVMWCRGPQGPNFICGACKARRCPLSSDVDAVVVDGRLGSDRARVGISSRNLMTYYRSFGLPMVALVGPDGSPPAREFPEVYTLPREAAAIDVVIAIDSLLFTDTAVG